MTPQQQQYFQYQQQQNNMNRYNQNRYDSKYDPNRQFVGQCRYGQVVPSQGQGYQGQQNYLNPGYNNQGIGSSFYQGVLGNPQVGHYQNVYRQVGGQNNHPSQPGYQQGYENQLMQERASPEEDLLLN